MVFLLYFIGFPLIIAVLMDYFGPVEEIIINVIDLIPFGRSYYEFAVQLVNSLGGQVVGYRNFNEYLTIGYIIGELTKGLFTVIIFEALNLGVCMLLGFVDSDGRINPEGVWNRAKCLLITAIDALVAACLSPIPLKYISSNLHSLGGVWSSIVSFLLSVVLVGGGVAFFVFLSSFSVGMAIAYVFIKFFLIGACRITVPYLAILAILVILIGWQNGLFFLSAGGVALLLIIGLMLGSIEMILKGVLSKRSILGKTMILAHIVI